MTIAIFGGLITWLLTKIIVESTIFAPLRRAVEKRGSVALFRSGVNDVLKAVLRGLRGDDLHATIPPPPRWHHRLADKVLYLLNCHLCAGVWIGIGVAFVVSGPLSLLVLNGLVYKAIGHFLLLVENRFDPFVEEPAVLQQPTTNIFHSARVS